MHKEMKKWRKKNHRRMPVGETKEPGDLLNLEVPKRTIKKMGEKEGVSGGVTGRA